MKNSPRLLGAAAALLLLASGCSGTGAQGTSSQPGQPKVVVAFYPFQYVAERVTGSSDITSLTAPGQEPHDLELSPRQVADIESADVVIYQKGFQPAVDEAIAQHTPAHVVDVASIIPLKQFGTGNHPAEEEEGGEHGHDEHAHDEHGETPGAGEHAHDHEHAEGTYDPHTWLDPTNMVTITQAVAKTLGEVKPDQKATYEKNAQAAEADFKGLDERWATGTKTCQTRTFITSHAAFGYLADHYKLNQVAIRGLSPDEEPSPARLAEIGQVAKQQKVSTIFTETLVSPAVSDTLARELKLQTAVLDPIEGLTDKSAARDYVGIMDANLKALRTANRCS